MTKETASNPAEAEEKPVAIAFSPFGLGQKVRYVRLDAEGNVLKGTARVIGFVLDHTKRPVHILKDGDKTFNLEIQALDGTEVTEAAYVEHLQKIRSFADEKNAEIKSITEGANNILETMHNSFFHPPVNV